MPTTTPDGIYYADSSTAMSAEAISAAEATSVQAALDTLINDSRQQQTYFWTDSSGRTSQTGMRVNDLGYQADTNITYRYNGSIWVAWQSDWITYAPTLVNISLGTGSSTQYRYRHTGGVVEVDFSIRLGTGGSFTGSPSMTLPVNAVALRYNNMSYDGVASAANAAGNIYPISVLANGAAVDSVWFWSTTTGAYAVVTATVPHTWALNSVLQGKFRFVPA